MTRSHRVNGQSVNDDDDDARANDAKLKVFFSRASGP